MTSEITVALLGLAGTLAGSFLGVVTASKLTEFRLKALEDKVAGTTRSSSAPMCWRARCMRCSTTLRN